MKWKKFAFDIVKFGEKRNRKWIVKCLSQINFFYYFESSYLALINMNRKIEWTSECEKIGKYIRYLENAESISGNCCFHWIKWGCRTIYKTNQMKKCFSVIGVPYTFTPHTCSCSLFRQFDGDVKLQWTWIKWASNSNREQ